MVLLKSKKFIIPFLIFTLLAIFIIQKRAVIKNMCIYLKILYKYISYIYLKYKDKTYIGLVNMILFLL
ncbi:hypothetical protein CON70_04925 [Bacillus pseudomycoides]|nr:hypothetical protein CON70_04925 [Bacillus pseudomycoides]